MNEFNEYENRKGQRRKNLNSKKVNSKRNVINNKGNNNRDSYLINVFEDTVSHFNTNQHFSAIKQTDSLLYNLCDEFDEAELEINYNSEEASIVEVKDVDTLDVATELCSEGYKPLVLNMASDYKPGGGVRSGKTAQEECIFRRCNAHLTHPEEWYPLEWDEVIFSPTVTVIKDSKYAMLPNFCDVGMLAVAAIRKPKLKYGMYSDEDREIMTLKIEIIFKIAIKHKYDSLVLGALGCGVFENPPEEVASIFKVMINTYGRYFKKIVFAVLSVQSNENIRTFQRVLL
jgi:uncharacterized protein (TIGR02452 family)